MVKLLHPDDDFGAAHRPAPGHVGAERRLEAEGPGATSLRRRLALACCCASTTPTANEEQEVLAGRGDRPCRGRLHAARGAHPERVGGRQPRRLQGHHAAGAEHAPASGPRRSPSSTSAIRTCSAASTRRKDSPYGYQEQGGFDCSGFVWWVLKMHFKYPISVNERGASDMARSAKPRISRSNLKPGDIMFWGPNGTDLDRPAPSTTPASTWAAAGSSTRRARATA